jgi:alkanesulfonate monooxygenase SsuD/methylene tetrahydromethanopterin reductase-like flavin-dependent oxidoreductase (luciferase family)
MYLNEADEAAWDAGGHAILKDVTLTGTPEEIRQRVAAYAEQGVTELGFQPYGAQIERERNLSTWMRHRRAVFTDWPPLAGRVG